MKSRLAALGVLFFCVVAWPADVSKPISDKDLLAALAVLSFEKPIKSAAEFEQAMSLYLAYERNPQSKALKPPKAALTWVPAYGPCAVIEPFLTLVFNASLHRDHLLQRPAGSVHRAWKAVFKAYDFFRHTPGNDPLEISAINEMMAKEAEGILAAEAARIEAAWMKARLATAPAPSSP